MQLDKFLILFIKEHITQTWIAYVLLFISIICIIFIGQFNNLTNWESILEGISLSYIAAYIFYCFINLVPEYNAQKKSIITIENELDNIVINISNILGIIKSFSNDGYTNINLPNHPIYLKEQNFNWKTFFNPRSELTMYINKLQNELNKIKIKYCVLPINLISILNKIDKLNIAQKLNNIYFCIDKRYYDITISGVPDCFIELEKIVNEIKKFGIQSIHINIFKKLNEHEEQEYIKEINDIKTHINCKLHNGKIYKGYTRIQ